MINFGLSRSRAALFGAFLLPILASCGGGSGGSSNGSNAATPVPTSTSTNASCDNSTFTPNYASSVSLLRWSRFPLRIFFVQNGEFSAARRNLALTGFNQWVSATNGRADYTVVSDRDDANVVVSFFTFTGGSGDTLGTTTVNYGSNNVIQEATVELGITGDGSDDILTAAHEYGHTLGITGHSPQSADIMYFTGNRSGDLTASDINTLLTAYCDNFNRAANRTSAAVGPLKTIVIH